MRHGILGTAGLALLLALGTAATGYGAALIETRDSDDTTNTLWIDGQRLRVAEAGEAGYMLFDLSAGQALAVDPESRAVIDYSAMAADPGDAAPAFPEARVEAAGAGPDVAGFATRRYRVTAGDQACGEVLLSPEAAERLPIQSIAEARRSLDAMFPGDPADTACDQALSDAPYAHMEQGYPMRVLRAGGEVMEEVVRIEPDAPLPPGGLEPPQGFQHMDIRQMMESMGGAMP